MIFDFPEKRRRQNESDAPILYRPMTEADAEAAYLIGKDADPDAWSKEMFTFFCNENAVVAEENGRVLGFAIAVRIISRIVMGNFAVLESRRGEGIGRELLRALIKQVAEAGYEEISLQVRTTNHAAIKLYRSLGWRITETLENWYGPEETAFEMNLRIRPDGGVTVLYEQK